MKTVVCLLLATTTILTAGFKLPKGVYRADKLEDAATEAQKDSKALAFVYTDETST